MKEFIDNIKDGFECLPQYLAVTITICLIAGIINGIDSAFDFFVMLFYIWLAIFIGIPCVFLLLDTINRIFGLKTNKK